MPWPNNLIQEYQKRENITRNKNVETWEWTKTHFIKKPETNLKA